MLSSSWHHRTPTGRSPKAMFAGDEDRGALVKPADKMEQERASVLRERQIADLIEGDEVEACEVSRLSALLVVPTG